MKSMDMLDLIGEVDEAYYEDMAHSISGRKRNIRRIAVRCGAAAAVIAVVSVTAVMFASIFREGIVQQPAVGSTSQTQTASAETSASESEPEKPRETLPTDLFEVVQTTAVTTTEEPEVTTTTALILPFPADAEMPDASLHQKVGNRFLVNSLSQSGVLAVTLTDVQLYESLDEADLTFDDLTASFREENQNLRDFYDGKTNSDDWSIQNGALGYMYLETEGDSIQQNWRFIKATITVENLNAVSWLGNQNGQIMPDGSVCSFDLYDFDTASLSFGVLTDCNALREKNPNDSFFPSVMNCGNQYNSAEGRFYDDELRRSFIHVEPGEAITFEIGAFLPRIYTEKLESQAMLGYEIGTDLKPYYMFGTGGISKPYVELDFDE